MSKMSLGTEEGMGDTGSLSSIAHRHKDMYVVEDILHEERTTRGKIDQYSCM